jgi:hypothetical protein
MATLRVAFLSALILEPAAALATALVAVEVGLRLLAGHIGYETALLVLLLTPEAYLPLRNAGAQFHASGEGAVASGRARGFRSAGSRRQPTPDPLYEFIVNGGRVYPVASPAQIYVIVVGGPEPTHGTVVPSHPGCRPATERIPAW